jgi:PEP-CTERM motif
MIRSLLILTLAAGPLSAAPLAPDFGAAVFTGVIPENDYFPLVPGPTHVILAEGEEDGEPFTERSELTVLGPGPTILGVQTTTQLDRAYEGDLLVEETRDYYATDIEGNVWYFGEDVTNFIYDDEDNLIDTNNQSAWIAGVDGAQPGWIMPGSPVVGLSYYQEIAAANGALDQAMIWMLDATLEIDGIGLFESVLVTLETTELDPDAREFKYYARGLGLIGVDEGLSLDLTDPELVFRLQPSPVPVPATLPLLLAGIGVLAVGSRRKRLVGA